MPMLPVIFTGLVGENVAEHIFRDDDVKLRRVLADLHGAVVHEHLAVLDLGVLGLQAVHDGAPQAAGVQHVGLIHTGQLLRRFIAVSKPMRPMRSISCSE